MVSGYTLTTFPNAIHAATTATKSSNKQKTTSSPGPNECKAQPRHALLCYPFHNMAAHSEATPTREGI